MNETGIIWTEVTWNPMSGCTKISEECKHCYAYTLAEAKRGSPAFPNGFDMTLREHKLREPHALKKPSLIFANSMSDLFHESLTDTWRDRVLAVIRDTPQHQYQVLTKRPERAVEYFRTRKVPANYWAGVTVGHPKRVDRIDWLRQIDAEIRFVSAEPILAPLTLDLSGIHWLISGGESGYHLWNNQTCRERGMVFYDRVEMRWRARPDRIEWVRSLRDQCVAQDVRFYHKQWGGAKGHDAGRELDGRTWDEFPRYPASGSWDTKIERDKRSLPLLPRDDNG